MPDAKDAEFEDDKQVVIAAWNRSLKRLAVPSVVALVVVAVESIPNNLMWLLGIFVLFEIVWWVLMLRWHSARIERFRQLERRPDMGPA